MNVLPGPELGNGIDAATVAAEAFSDGVYALSGCVPPAYLSDFVWSKSGVVVIYPTLPVFRVGTRSVSVSAGYALGMFAGMMAAPFEGASFGDHVGHVISLRAEEQVQGLAAKRPVAQMQYHHPFGDSAIVVLPRKPVSKSHLSVDLKTTVTVTPRRGTIPHPAWDSFVKRPVLVEEIEESLFGSAGEVAGSRAETGGAVL